MLTEAARSALHESRFGSDDAQIVPPELTQRLTDYGMSVQWSDLPADVQTIAKQCFLDWLGVTIAGWDEPTVTILLASIDGDAGGKCATLIGDGTKSSARDAAFVNGAASHALDYDDVHPPSRVHPSAPVYSAALAVGEANNASGSDVLAAFVVGVEIQSRLGLLMGKSHYYEGWVNTATLGTFGSAIASGRLLRLARNDAQHLFGIAAVQAAGLRAALGTMCKPMQVGKAASNGVLSALLASKGFKGPIDVLERRAGFVETQSRAIEPEAVLTGLGTQFHSRGVIFKYHVSCFGTHAPIEAVRALQCLQQFRLDQVVRLEVRVEPQYLSVCNITTPRDDIEAKFSIAHAAALTLHGIDTSAASAFGQKYLIHDKITATRSKIFVSGDPALPRAAASVTALLNDGTQVCRIAHANVPELELDVQWRRLEAKFGNLTGKKFSAAKVSQLIASVRNFEEIPNVAAELQMWRLNTSHSELSS
jgi:2-methylcitrate dehydratase PrpD